MSLWIGTYAKCGGKGLHPLRVSQDQLEVGRPVSAICNASYGIWNHRHRLAYFVDEQDAGRVVAWRQHDAVWLEDSVSGSGGAAPCYLGLHPAASLLVVANYDDGSVALLSLDPSSGAIRELVDVARPVGRGPDVERQTGPHAHCAVFSEDGTWLYHVDLGLDRILAYPIADDRLGEPVLAFTAPPGSGPRHLVLHPDKRRALLICELSAEVHLLVRQGATFSALTCEPSSCRAGEAGNLGGHLALIDGGHIGVTNRGHDNLTVFRIGESSLERNSTTPSA